MLKQINGIHHITSLASDAVVNNDFFTRILGLHRVKKTVNFDAPEVYHLYYGIAGGVPGTVMTYFPYPDIGKGSRGAGEIGETRFSLPKNSLSFWHERLSQLGVGNLQIYELFGEKHLGFSGPDGESLALVEHKIDLRAPADDRDIPLPMAIRGFHSVRLNVVESDGTIKLLELMNYRVADCGAGVTRMICDNGNGADIIDVKTNTSSDRATQGSGSVHHIAFAVRNTTDQLAVREVLIEAGYSLTPVIDRDYFKSVYFRIPAGILFEIATNDPGFGIDEKADSLGQALCLPAQHTHLRAQLEQVLPPLGE